MNKRCLEMVYHKKNFDHKIFFRLIFLKPFNFCLIFPKNPPKKKLSLIIHLTAEKEIAEMIIVRKSRKFKLVLKKRLFLKQFPHCHKLTIH